MEHETNIDHPYDLTLPPSFRLFPGEHAYRAVVRYEHKLRDKIPSSLEQMLRLTGARKDTEIGYFGPSQASTTFEANAPEHLRLYEALFGRDSLRVAIELIPNYPMLARTTLLALAKLQGVTENTMREEEPGRIIHETRDADDPIAQQLSAERGWGWPYYGSVDATPEFIRTLTAYCQRSEENRAFLAEEYVDRHGAVRTMSYALEMALDWIHRRRQMNDEGLLEYHSVLPHGIENQVWKDSWDAYHHSDGTKANHESGIASIEVQVTAYDALIDAAELYEDVLDQQDTAKKLRHNAEQLKQTILSIFWTDEKAGYFVLGTDRDESGNLRQLKIRTSNMGHTLHSRLLKGDDPSIVQKREAVVAQLFSGEMLNVSGIRTLASDEVRFRPGAYHNGSVWLWDTHHISNGLRRLGYTDKADILDHKILKVVEDTRVFPEYVRGDDRAQASINEDTIVLWDDNYARINVVEQPPQEVQAWTVAAILATKKRIHAQQSQQL